MQIHADTYYGHTELLPLGVAFSDLDAANRAGQLPAIRHASGALSLKGSDLLAWLGSRGNGGTSTAHAPARPGTRPTATYTDPIQTWNSAINAKVAGGMPRHEAVRQTARENPDLKSAYVEAYNQMHAAPARR